MIDDDEANFPHELLLTNRQVANRRKALADKSSTDINLSKTQINLSLTFCSFTKNRITANKKCN